jgi:hypothetical protein
MTREPTRRWCVLLAALVAAAALPYTPVARAANAPEAVLRSRFAEWRWSRTGARTTAISDLRTGRRWGRSGADFALLTPAGALSSDRFTVRRVTWGSGHVRVVLQRAGVVVTRDITAYDDVAGFRVDTTVRSAAPLPLAGARLAQVRTLGVVGSQRHAFRAGADWRAPGWDGPGLAVGNAHPGTWRATSADPNGPGQWLSLASSDRDSLFFVTEANDLPSVGMAMADSVATPAIDYARDVILLGPFEEQIHVENDRAPTGRVRVLMPGEVVGLPTVFVGFGHGDGDEAWQFHQYLTAHRAARFDHAITFNSNGTNTPGVSVGAKDGMNLATIKQVAPLARRLGIETFILDDGWQADSGDWVPDPARFPNDPDLAQVRAAIAPMRLGMWMTPLHFHPESKAFRAHPQWACTPVGDALAAYNTADPSSGSNAAGIGEWNRAALGHVEARIRIAVERWGVRYFKFDFLAWLDCAGHGDLYALHDAFVAMLDRLESSYPGVTFQIDETNDYRLFPFESVVRGPSWFQNGAPEPTRLLHNLWNLSPFVPTVTIGQHFLGDRSYATWPVDTLMIAALFSHLTFFSDLRTLPPAVIDAAAPWTAFYRRYRTTLTNGVVYPLLDDPLTGGWTALQSWNPVTARGALLVFRQDAPSATVRVALRNVPDGRRFSLLVGPTGKLLRHTTSRELQNGLDVSLPTRGAQALLIVPRAN